jgi:flagellar basal-body rod modification protein FlgD
MVGRNVLVESSMAEMSVSSSLKGAVDLPVSTGNITLTIKDAAGQLVRQTTLGGHEAGLVEFSWDGFNDAGKHVNAGVYQVSAEYAATGGNVGATTLIQAQVESVTLQKDGSSPKLNLGELGSFTIDNVRQVL